MGDILTQLFINPWVRPPTFRDALTSRVYFFRGEILCKKKE
nr:MAG TPA: hypothetical protein [Caudoviricetes sp.]